MYCKSFDKKNDVGEAKLQLCSSEIAATFPPATVRRETLEEEKFGESSKYHCWRNKISKLLAKRTPCLIN